MLAERLQRITRASDELDRCVRERGQKDNPGATYGELDWYEELHLAIYDEEAKASMDTGQKLDKIFAPGDSKLREVYEKRKQRERENAKVGIGGGPTRATTLPETPAERKTYPVASGVLDYFPDAIAAISHLSWKGNEQHNPGQPLHWARGKSTDEADTMLRHFLQRGTIDTDGIRHSVKMAWRALALLQKEIEGE